MIKKFNELYGGGGEMDRKDWPDTPEVKTPLKSDKEKISIINGLCFDLDSDKISLEEFASSVKNILSVSDRKYPGPTNL